VRPGASPVQCLMSYGEFKTSSRARGRRNKVLPVDHALQNYHANQTAWSGVEKVEGLAAIIEACTTYLYESTRQKSQRRKGVTLLRFYAEQEAQALATAHITPADDLGRIQTLAGQTNGVLSQILDEVYQRGSAGLGTGQIKSVPAMAHAARRADDQSGQMTGQDVNYIGKEPITRKRVANLVHELTHTNVQDAFGGDYVNYSDAPDAKRGALPGAVVGKGRIQNEGPRQDARRNDAADMAIVARLRRLHGLAQADKHLPPSGLAEVLNQLDYGMKSPHLEYDTVVNQMLVWCHFWNVSGESAFLTELQQVATEALAERQAGQRDMGGH